MVWTDARAERKVAERLLSRGFNVWLPTVTEKRRWSDRWKSVTVPLFPGYLFACTQGAGYVPVIKTPGVLTLVKEAGSPAMLTREYVDRLRRVVEDPGSAVETLPEAPQYNCGDEVLVREGPLAGLRGVVMQLRGARKLLVWVTGVGRGLLCVLGAALVEPVLSAEQGRSH